MSDPKQRNTDLANGVRFRTLMRDRAAYDAKTGTWYVWDSRRWCRVSPRSMAYVRQLAREVVLSIDSEVARATDDDQRKRLREWATQSQSNARMSAMIAAAETEQDLWVNDSDYDADPNLLNCMNGTVDLRTGECRPHDPNDKITRLVPVEYRPNAVAPKFVAALRRAFAKDESGDAARYFLKALGYSLRGNNPEQVAFFAVGDTNTGKSLTLEVVAEVLGSDYADSTVKRSVLSKNKYGNGASDTDLNKLLGRRFAAITEASLALDLDEDSFKSHTGSSVFSLRHLYGERFTVPLTWTFFVAANAMPNIERWEPALGRRMVVFDSGPTVPEHERDLSLRESILRDESEGVLAALVAGSVHYEADRKRLGHVFNVKNAPAAVRDAIAEVERDSDHAMAFIRDRLEFGESHRVSKASAFRAFKDSRGRAVVGHTAQSFNKAVLRYAEAEGLTYVAADTRNLLGVRLRELTLAELAEAN